MTTPALSHPKNLRAAFAALGAALLFGASTPFAKQLVGELSALLLAGLLYLGAGIGLAAARLLRDRGWRPPQLTRSEWPWLLSAIAVGGLIGPTLLLIGLSTTSAGAASLLLNLEAVFTALLAWLLFRENAGTRVVLGMAFIVAGGLALSVLEQSGASSDWRGALAIIGACLCWAVDNNLTRKLAASDALFIAGSKGLIAGIANTALAFAFGALVPSWNIVGPALLIGFLGYGVSLFLFVLALRGLGAARTGAYFSTAPFIGAAIAVALFREPTGVWFWLAAAFMATGVWLHLTENHEHRHTHEALRHAHPHVHDEHHRHEHDFPWDDQEPHTHQHRHTRLTHAHPHYPDIHHRHRH